MPIPLLAIEVLKLSLMLQLTSNFQKICVEPVVTSRWKEEGMKFSYSTDYYG